VELLVNDVDISGSVNLPNGRTVKLFSGPETDMSILLLAIKSTSIDSRPIIIPSFKIYNRTGSAHLVKATCRLSSDGTCSLEFESVVDPIHPSPVPEASFTPKCDESPSVKDGKNHFNARARYNFVMGLEMHKAQMHAKSQAQPSD
jgi:hypothetical protein